MNRRSFLQTAGAGALAALLPTWMVKRAVLAQEIDLQPFCAAQDSFFTEKIGEADVPFIQKSPDGLFKFATDRRICVKVPGLELDKADAPRKHPNALALAWKAKGSPWKPWPAQNYQLGPVPCPDCDGEGWTLENSNRMKVKYCRTCDESGEVVGPAFQRIGEYWIDCYYDAKIRKHLGDGEFSIVQGRVLGRTEPVDQILFRFQGGEALLAIMKTRVVEARIEYGKSL